MTRLLLSERQIDKERKWTKRGERRIKEEREETEWEGDT